MLKPWLRIRLSTPSREPLIRSGQRPGPRWRAAGQQNSAKGYGVSFHIATRSWATLDTTHMKPELQGCRVWDFGFDAVGWPAFRRLQGRNWLKVHVLGHLRGTRTVQTCNFKAEPTRGPNSRMNKAPCWWTSPSYRYFLLMVAVCASSDPPHLDRAKRYLRRGQVPASSARVESSRG